MSVWKALGRGKLQEIIGQDELGRLETLLPGLKGSSFDEDMMYSLEGLSRIFDAFFGDQLLGKKEYRRLLFNSLPPEKIDAALLSLGIRPKKETSFDEKINILATKGWKTRETASQIAKVLELPDDALPDVDQAFTEVEDIAAPTRRYRPLKDYQVSVFNQAMEKLAPARARFIVQMPTGSGKTRTAVEIITDFINNQAKPDDVVLWLAHSEELCEQAVSSFMDIAPHVIKSPMKLIRFWGKSEDVPHDFSGNAFLVSSFQKLYSKVKSSSVGLDAIRRRVALIIVDEAHKVLAPTYKEVTSAFISERARVVGLTATPGRSLGDHEQNKALADFFFSKIIEIKPDKGTVIDYLRSKRVLSHTQYDPLHTNLSYDLSAADKMYMEKFFDLPPGFLYRLGNDDIRNAEIVKRLEKEAAAGNKIIFFACSVEQSKFVSALLRFLNVNSAHIDGSTPKNQRAAIINRFKDGNLAVLCNYGVLSTGFDAPQTNVVFIARPTSSIVLYSQMIGRGLRGPAIGGTERCKIIDVIDNIKGFSNENSVYSYFENYYDV